MNDGFLRVTKAKPCPICKKADWCGYSADGVWAVCMRTPPGLKQCRNGGYLHRLKDAPPAPVRRRLAPPQPRPMPINMAAYHAALRARWTPALLAEWAERLDVWEYALDALAPAWDALNQALAFPMRDGEGKVVGIRLRNAAGEKWAVRGSAEGLFYSPTLAPGPELVICEGPTDTAAALSIDLPAVGRPSCSGCLDELAVLIRRLHVRQLTVIPDCDSPHQRTDGSIWYPGMDGAAKLIGHLKRMARVVVPPVKDMRAWFATYTLTREKFDFCAKNATWRMAG